MGRRMEAAGLALACSAALSACNEYGIPAGTSAHREFNFLDMGDQSKAKAQRGDLLGGPDFMPPPGAIPRGYDPYPFVGQPDAAGAQLKNPLPPGDPKLAERGKLVFERACVPCHDAEASGKGKVTEKGFPVPPSLMTQKLRDWSDGRIFHVISQGQNIMPSYATLIRPHDRWAAIAHVRVLQSKLPVAPPAPGAASTAPAAAPASPQPPAGSASGLTGGVPPPQASVAPAASSAPPPRRGPATAPPPAASTPSTVPAGPRAVPSKEKVK